MSYDLAVFDLATAPKDRTAFIEWYDEITEWEEDRDYSEVTDTSPALIASSVPALKLLSLVKAKGLDAIA